MKNVDENLKFLRKKWSYWSHFIDDRFRKVTFIRSITIVDIGLHLSLDKSKLPSYIQFVLEMRKTQSRGSPMYNGQHKCRNCTDTSQVVGLFIDFLGQM